MSASFGILGAGGFAREIMPLARAYAQAHPELGVRPQDIVFVDRAAGPDLNGHAVVAEADFFGRTGRRLFVLGVGDGATRKRAYEAARAAGGEPVTLTGDWVTTLDDVAIGAGGVLCGYSMLTSNVRIGLGFQGNIYSYVAHDCVIGDYVTFAPGVKCNGNVVIEDFAYIGTGAVLRQGAPDKPLRIGRGATVGMGAVVTKDVPEGTTVVGNPARPLTKDS